LNDNEICQKDKCVDCYRKKRKSKKYYDCQAKTKPKTQDLGKMTYTFEKSYCKCTRRKRLIEEAPIDREPCEGRCQSPHEICDIKTNQCYNCYDKGTSRKSKQAYNPEKVTCKSINNRCVCKDIDECKSNANTCEAHEICSNKQMTGFKCIDCYEKRNKDKRYYECARLGTKKCRCRRHRKKSNSRTESNDVDECKANTHTCGDQEACYNKKSGFKCVDCYEKRRRDKNKYECLRLGTKKCRCRRHRRKPAKVDWTNTLQFV